VRNCIIPSNAEVYILECSKGKKKSAFESCAPQKFIEEKGNLG